MGHSELPLVGGWVRIEDLEDGSTHQLNGEAVARGLPVWATEHPASWARYATGEFDARDGDVFVQCCLFGKVLYG